MSKLTLLTVPKAGHFVPTTNLLTTQNFLADYIKYGKLTCHQKTAYLCEAGPIMCKYMNNCNRNGICNIELGRCDCNPGFLGADCSVKIINIPGASNNTQTTQVQGIDYLYYQLSDNVTGHFVFTLSSSNPVDIFIKQNDVTSDPTEFNNDIAAYKQTRFTLRSENWPGLKTFTLAIKINGANFKTNTYVASTLTASFNLVPSTPAPQGTLEEEMETSVFTTLRSWWNEISQ